MENKGTIIGILDLQSELVNEGNNYKIKSEYAGKWRAPIIKAISDGKYINPKDINGERVLIKIKEQKDRKGRKINYILLFHKSNYIDKINLKKFTIISFDCKQTTVGSKILIDEIQNADINVTCNSNGLGTHWTHIIAGLNLKFKYVRQYKSCGSFTKDFIF